MRSVWDSFNWFCKSETRAKRRFNRLVMELLQGVLLIVKRFDIAVGS